jgi:hypothetical protein
MRVRLPLAAIGLLGLAACMPAPPPQPGVSTAPLGGMTRLSVDDAESAVAARLQALGFTVEDLRQNGVIQGQMTTGAPASWAACDRVVVTERDDRSRTHWADADTRRATVTARFSELGGQTSVVLTPRFAGVYLDRFDNLPFDRACASTGELERQLLAALGGTAS